MTLNTTFLLVLIIIGLITLIGYLEHRIIQMERKFVIMSETVLTLIDMVQHLNSAHKSILESMKSMSENCTNCTNEVSNTIA